MWGRALGLITMLALAACGEAPMEGGPVGVANTPVLLHPDDPDVRQVGRLQFEGGTELSSLHPAFGGWSGLEIHPDGERVLLLSDRGTWLSGELEFDENFQLLGLKNTQIFPLLGLDGAPVSGPNSDAEGLADMGHGVYAVSFERDHRVWVYDLGRNWEFIDQAIPETLDGPPGREHWPENGGMEALSSSPLGRRRLTQPGHDPSFSGDKRRRALPWCA